LQVHLEQRSALGVIDSPMLPDECQDLGFVSLLGLSSRRSSIIPTLPLYKAVENRRYAFIRGFLAHLDLAIALE
jgi:hypothetical protein